MELSPGRELHPKPVPPTEHTSIRATVELPEFLGRPHHHAALRGGRNSHRVSVNWARQSSSARDSHPLPEFELPNAVAGRTTTLRIELPADTERTRGLRRQPTSPASIPSRAPYLGL